MSKKNTQSTTAMLDPTQRIWIFGAGTFGALAAARLSRRVPTAHMRVMDHRRARLAQLPAGIPTERAEAAAYCAAHLGAGADPDWIVPAVPIHLAWEVIRRWLHGRAALRTIPPHEDLLAALPNAVRGPGGAVYTSIAAFLCPDNCPAPADRCTHTGRPRPVTLFRDLPRLAGSRWETVVIRSRQLAPGVGGYPPAALRAAGERVGQAAGPLLLATACRCHGVVHCLRPG